MESPSIISSEYDGKPRRLWKRTCSECGGPFWAPKHLDRKYCSQNCSASSKRLRIDFTCHHCQKPSTALPKRVRQSRSGILFCSRACKDSAQSIGGCFQQAHAGTARNPKSARSRALKHFPPICVLCGYDRYVEMLDADHVDGNRSNPDIKNLQLLCVWCHALKTRGVPHHERKS